MAGVATELVVELAGGLRETVLPALGSHAGRSHAGTAGDDGVAGDITFEIDEQAEAYLERFVAERMPGVAFYSEDRGLVMPGGGGKPEHVLIVDPIDGTRPALAGFESACVSVALAAMGDGRPTMADLQAGVVVEIKSGARFVARRGEGVVSDAPIALSANTDLSRLFWVYGLRGRPARETIEVLAELIDGSSVGGGTFDLGSAAYDMTRVLTGQLDAYVEPSPRVVDEIPGMRERFEAVAGGAILNNSPYDLAAAALCLWEGGAVLTDASGRSLDDRPLLGSDPDHQIAVVASANPALHEQLLAAVERGIVRLAGIVGQEP